MRSYSFGTLETSRPVTERHNPDDLNPKQYLLWEANETAWQKSFLFNPYPANVENKYGDLLIMSADGRWDLTRRLKG